jgi:hypothetical protein
VCSDIVLQHVQVKVAGLKARYSHSAASCCIGSGLNEVVLFGGLEMNRTLADTTVLRFGESILL